MTALLVWFALNAAAATAPETDGILDTMVRWTRTGVEQLRLDDAPPPHRVVLAVAEVRGYQVRASFGELLFEIPIRNRQGRVEVIVGNDELDSSRFQAGSSNRFARRIQNPRQQLTLAVTDGELALDRDLWTSIDASYKKAIQRWQAKVAAREATGGDDPPPDWSAAEPITAIDLSPLPAVDEQGLREIALVTSRALRDIEGIDQSDVVINSVEIRSYLATSEGTRLVQPEGYTAIHVEASSVTDRGVAIKDELQWVVRRAADLPPGEQIVAAARALGENVRDRAASDDGVEYYEGPVIFEGRAAAEFFRYLVPLEISGTPPVPEAGRSYQRQTRSGPRLGRRLLPNGWSIVDDPSATPEGLAGGQIYDREGVAATSVELVVDGYVNDLLMTRVPRADLTRSNGHARGLVTQSWLARPTVWRVSAPRRLADKAFDKAVRRTLERTGHDPVLVIQRLARDRAGRLPAPTRAVWRHADGREEPVTALEFQNIDRRTLRNVAAAGGGQTTLAYLAAAEPRGYPARERGVPTVLTTPQRLLVEDLELVFPGTSSSPHAYPRP